MLNQKYDLYRGDKKIGTGTLKALSDYTGLFQGSLLNYSYKKYLEKNKSRNVFKVYKVSDDS